MKKTERVLLMLILLSCVAVGAQEQQGHDQGPLPFVPGETLTYKLKWGFFTVGSAVLEVKGPVNYSGQSAYHLTFDVRTNAFADRIYKVRDHIESYIDTEMSRSLHYRKMQIEGKHERDIVVNFDWLNKTAQYSNFGEQLDPVSVLKDTFDPLSVLFAARRLDFNRTPLVIPVTDGKKVVDVNIEIDEKRQLKTPFGTLHTVLTEPDTKDLGGVFKKSDDANIQIWFSDDERKLPVRLRSKVVVGHFQADLIAIDQVTLDEPAGN